jgi:hypothetical protein
MYHVNVRQNIYRWRLVRFSYILCTYFEAFTLKAIISQHALARIESSGSPLWRSHRTDFRLDIFTHFLPRLLTGRQACELLIT